MLLKGYEKVLEAHGLTVGDTQLLTVMTIALPEIGISGKYVITERTIEPHSSDLESEYRITLKLTNRDYLRSYGEIISDLRKGLHQLSIREDDVVIDTHQISDTETLAEEVISGRDFAYYAVSSGSSA